MRNIYKRKEMHKKACANTVNSRFALAPAPQIRVGRKDF
jgi:hypothetical protein